jgi:hypothetical protein
MGFVIIDYKISLTRDQVVKLLVDSESVKTVTEDGENIIIMGYGRDKLTIDKENGGIVHLLLTNIEFIDHDEYMWSEVRLVTSDKVTYSGIVSPVHH